MTTSDTTTRNPFGELKLLAITWPIFCENLMRLLLVSVDTIMLSHYSPDAVAAVGAVNQVLGMVFLLYTIVAAGSSILIAQLIGAGAPEHARQAASCALLLNLVFGVGLSFAVAGYATDIVVMLNLPTEIRATGALFLRILGMFSFMQAMLATSSALLRSHGLTRVPMVALIFMNLLNVAGNWVVLYGPWQLPLDGVAGVACSSVISQALVTLLLLTYVVRRLGLNLIPRRRFDRWIVTGICKVGLPTTGENICYQASQLAITYIITGLGTVALTARVITFNIMFLIMLTSMSLAQGTQIIVGHKVGARRFDDAYRTCFRSVSLGLVASLTLAVLFAAFSPLVLSLYTTDPAIIATGRTLLVIAILIEPGRVLNMVIISALKASGDASFPAIIGILSMFLVAVGLSYLLGIHFKWGLIGIWFAFASDEWLRGIIMTMRWRSRLWQGKVLAMPETRRDAPQIGALEHGSA